MRHRLRESRALIALLVPVFLAAPLASAEIFKCTAKDGTALYQNFPCQFDSIAWMTSNPQAAKPSTAPDARRAAPKTVSVPVASAAPADAREPRIGMTPEEVRAILGDPLEAVQDEPIEGGTETWRYVDKTIQFDRTHRVVSVQAW